REQGGRISSHVARGDLVQQDVVVRLFERRRSGEDDVRQARRLIDVKIHSDEQLEPRERVLQSRAVRYAEGRVAGDRDQGADLTWARCFDFLGKAGDRELTDHLRVRADAAVVPMQPDTLTTASGS